MNESTSPSENNSAAENHPEAEGLTFWQVLSSTMAAAFGVQSSKNRHRDFSQGKPGQFIAMGIGFTVVFVLIIVGVVSLVLP